MPRKRKPRRGSLQYWPRKKARRIYPRQNFHIKGKEARPLGFAGWKAGMTHIVIVNNIQSQTYGKSITKPVTILDAPSLFCCGFRFYKNSPSSHVIAEKWSTKLPKGLELMRKTIPSRKNVIPESYDDVTLIVSTQPSKSGMAKRTPDVFELAIGGELNKKIEYAESMLGNEIHAADVFRPGEFVDVAGVTKGHGYSGSVKRFGIRTQGRKSQQMHRHVGSIGATTPRKVDWRVPMPGQYGFFTRTEFSKRIIMVGDDPNQITPKGGFLGYGNLKSFILVEGSVPGSRKRLVRLRKAARTTKVIPPEVTYISLASKQGA